MPAAAAAERQHKVTAPEPELSCPREIGRAETVPAPGEASVACQRGATG
jgi:hypothetical protein